MNSSYNMSREFKSVNIAILTVSDTRTKTTDKSGDFLSNAVVDAGHNVIHKRIVKDELVEITPLSIRLRKMELDQNKRLAARKKEKYSG